ncbi:MAG: orotidine-5'-phosphate decarboxylase [Desulfurococcales archaeon]|nr:orotidine-5'-phosphate decarboxylase [Desulfurococcales archaeon]MCE4622048.1 orotidine-5'-phosphate decarboxylase [Desulfurococcales archaeon]MCE4629386.1 orotidine-5'-phosphate decarboxylase [Desulfurococcales archaeon]
MKLPVIVGIDSIRGDTSKAYNIVSQLCTRVSGFKIGLPNILTCKDIGNTVRRACPDTMILADLKLADIGYTMKLVASHVVEWSDAIIAHSFPGVEGGLDELKEYLDSRGKKLVLVATMSNPGASKIMDKVLDDVITIIESIKPWGIVAPATRTEKIIYLRRRLPDTIILSPGIGAQGAKPGSAISAGANYEIIGRMIAKAENPSKVIEEIRPFYHV